MQDGLHLLTFLGAGNYYETTYQWQGRRVTARYAPVASVQFLKPTRITVFLTQEARAEVFPDFQTALAPYVGNASLHTHDIPLGRNEQEVWDLFDTVVEAILEPDMPFAFDVTHGLRSFPYVALLATAYVQAGFSLPVCAVLYGAFEVRDRSVTPNVAPMFDLSPLLTLLEWAVAADRFNRTGDARYLASLLKQVQKRLAQRYQDDARGMAERVRPIGLLRSTLTRISQALAVIRPHEVRRWAARIPQNIQEARAGLTEALAARPFLRLLNAIARSYQPLALDEAHEQDPYQRLQAERALLQWYVKHEYWAQAITLGREWLLSWVMYRLGIGQLEDEEERQSVSSVLNNEAERWLKAKAQGEAFRSRFLHQVPQLDEVLPLWKSLTQTRNDINHAGMRKEPGEAADLVNAVREHVQRLLALPLEPVVHQEA